MAHIYVLEERDMYVMGLTAKYLGTNELDAFDRLVNHVTGGFVEATVDSDFEKGILSVEVDNEDVWADLVDWLEDYLWCSFHDEEGELRVAPDPVYLEALR